MNIPLRSLLITLTLALSMVAGAVVHGMTLATPPRGPAGLQEIVICASDAAEATITIDASGNRVDPAREGCPRMPCPDCLGAAPVAVLPALLASARAVPGRSVTWATPRPVHPQRPYTHPAARGPPQKV